MAKLASRVSRLSHLSVKTAQALVNLGFFTRNSAGYSKVRLSFFSLNTYATTVEKESSIRSIVYMGLLTKVTVDR